MSEVIKPFGFGFGNETKQLPPGLLPGSIKALQDLFLPLDPVTRQASIFVEVRVNYNVKSIAGVFNNQEQLSFSRITQNLWKCDQVFSDFESLSYENSSIRFEYQQPPQSYREIILEGNIPCDQVEIDTDGLRRGYYT